MEQIIKHGDIFMYDFGNNAGSVQSNKRPVLVIQADSFNKTAPTIIVAAITSVIKKQYLASHVILPDSTGLKLKSMVLLEQLRTVNKEELSERIGFLNDEISWKRINIGLKKTFGFWNSNQVCHSDIRCLCSKCLSDYKSHSGCIIRRIDPFTKKKGHCDKCDGMGYDYFILERFMTK